MLISLRNFLRKNPVVICGKFLSIHDKRKVLYFSFIQSLLGLVDVLGIALLGLLGSLTISGVQSRNPNSLVSNVIEFLGIENRSFQIQVAIIAVLAAIFLAGKTLLSILVTKKILLFFSRRSASTSSFLVQKLLKGSLNSIQKRNPQDVIYSVTSGVSSMTLGVIGSAVSMVSDLFLLILIILGLLLVNTVMALSMTLYFGVIAVVLYVVLHGRAREIGERSAKLQIASNKKLLEALESFREIYVRNREWFYIKTYADSRSQFANLEAEQAFFPNISKYVMEMSVLFGALLISAALFISADATEASGVLTLFMAAGMRTAPAILRLQQGMLNIKMQFGLAQPTIKNIQELPTSDLLLETHETSKSNPREDFIGSVRLKGLSFKYPGTNRFALEEINFSISPGSTFAIVGPSAAGKSTLIDCILGLQVPTSGSISISGQSPETAIKLWPRDIGYVPQQVTLFEGTIAENVALGFSKEEIDYSAVSKALESAALKEYVDSLGEGIHSNIGEKGLRLSGGQKQRLGIARALYTSPGLVVLDEATSSLDGETEKFISESLKSLKGKVTMIIVAHRLTTIQNADAIAYIEKGRILAIGTFNDVRSAIPNFDNQAKLMGL